MKNTSAQPDVGQAWSANDIIGSSKDWLDRLFGWWYRFTTPPRATGNVSFARRESDRRARLLSTLVFFLLLVGALFLPLELLGGRLGESLNTIGGVSILIGALWANKAGKTILAAIIIVATVQLGWFSLVLQPTLTPPGVLQMYDTFVLTELVAVSLLPVRSIFLMATINSVFIAVDMLYVLHTPMEQLLHADLAQSLARPIALQYFVALVVALWVYSASKSNERANRAEMVASLEHTIAEQNQTAKEEKEELEASIEQIVRVHTDAINGQVIARIPYPPAKVLWPLVGVVNSLWVRLQRTQQTEKELQQWRERAVRSESQLQQWQQHIRRNSGKL